MLVDCWLWMSRERCASAASCLWVWRSWPVKPCSCLSLQAWDWLSGRARRTLGMTWHVANSVSEPVTHDTVVCHWYGSHLTLHTGLFAIFLSIFSSASWCLFWLSLLCCAFLKISPLPLSPPPHWLLEILLSCSFSFLPSFLPYVLPFSLFSPILVSRPPPSHTSHRYLTPRSKTEYYDVTKWVEDVNKNTRGPYLRYYLRPCSRPHMLVKNLPLLFICVLVRETFFYF